MAEPTGPLGPPPAKPPVTPPTPAEQPRTATTLPPTPQPPPPKPQQAIEKGPPVDMGEVEALRGLVPDAVTETGKQTDKPVAVVRTERVLDALRAAREQLKFDHLANYTATDYPLKQQIEVTYNLYSFAKKKHLVLKTRLPRDKAVAPSLTVFWAGANWDERELFDLFGIRFEGHPDLKRLFLPENWKGHPLRKDYPLQEEQFIGMDEQGRDVAYTTPGDDRW